jgi:1,2-diacylglycerol-3-alpha-glucose alpha-1,2-galactosyltransferase
MPERIRINVVSESAFTVQGHGVHSVFTDNTASLRGIQDLDVVTNEITRAHIAHAHTIGPFASLALSRSAVKVVTAHLTPESVAGSLIGGDTLARVTRRYLRRYYNHADAVVALSPLQSVQLRAMGVTSDIYVVPNAIAVVPVLTRGAARRQLGIEDDQKVVLSVGQLQPRKGVRDFHECARALPNVRFLWVGGFPFGRLTAEYATMLDIVRSCATNVYHVGQVPRERMHLYYAAADVYLHPSHQEHAPVAVLEAAAARLPLVLRDLPCYRALYVGKYLTGPGFAKPVHSLLTEHDLRDVMSRQSAQIAESYSGADAGHSLAELYRSLVRRADASPEI